ncbi:MAG: hypothetical protein HQL67_03690 [Magnetococcales bacterium]|nr:hypothetical protein [Magnetococcales bacterium]
MIRRFEVLLLQAAPLTSERWLDTFWLLPRNRAGVYREWLTGQAIPHQILAASQLSRERILDGDHLLFSVVILALPWKKISTQTRQLLLELSNKKGLVLVADVALLNQETARQPFGLHLRGHPGFASPGMKNLSGQILFQRQSRPFSSQGRDFGLRPLLRFLLQNWLLHPIQWSRSSRVVARWSQGRPAILEHPFGEARNLLLNFNPAWVLQHPAPLHGFLSHLLRQSGPAIACGWCWHGAAFLRMDDPGSSERVFLAGYDQGVMSGALWREVLTLLDREKAHLNVAIVPCWVDDGDRQRGRLLVAGQEMISRSPGDHHLSFEVVYHAHQNNRTDDYREMFAAMLNGVHRGLLTPLSHGLTHLTPQEKKWSQAKDRYRNTRWYREFSKPDHGSYAVELHRRLRLSAQHIADWCGQRPLIFVPSGHQRTTNTPVLAQQAGYRMISSRGIIPLTARISENRFLPGCYPEQWKQLQAWHQSGYPATLVFHDFDLVRHGVGWLKEQIMTLKKAGIDRFPSLEALAWTLSTPLIADTQADGRLTLQIKNPGLVGSATGVVWLRVAFAANRVTTETGEELDGWVIEAGETRIPIDPSQPPTRLTLEGPL